MERKIQAVFLDGDGTAWHYQNSDFGSSWGAIANAFGLCKDYDLLLKKYYLQKDKEGQWAREQVAYFKGKSIKKAEKSVYPIPYTKGVVEFARKTKGKIQRGLLTTGLDIIAHKAAQELDLDFCLCNILNRENGYFTGTVDYNVPLWNKHVNFIRICAEKKIKFDRVCYVGDTKADINCLLLAGLPVLFNPKDEEIKKIANAVTISDFRKLLNVIEEYEKR